MDEMDARLLDVFYDVQRNLPRQGPGDEGSTARALSLCSNLPEWPAILDIGCGPGMQTTVLAAESSGRIVAVDTCDEYLDELRERLQEAALAHRVEVIHADMSALEFSQSSFDLIWCEGAAYVMGVSQALRAWRPLLRNDGYLAFSELVWLMDSPPDEAATFFASGYPAMRTIEATVQDIRDNGYTPAGDFTLPDSAWWTDYYTPLEAKLPALKRKYDGDEDALSIVEMSEIEIDIRRRFGDSYGYHFFVAQKAD